jgi:hypothetical protein
MGIFSRIFRSKPAEPSVVVHEAHGGAIRIFETPRGVGWGSVEETREGDGYTVMVLKYLLPAPPTPLVLLAKVYTHGPDVTLEATPPDWREALGALFSSIATLDAVDTTQTTMTGALPAWEAVIDGVGADPVEPLRIRERRSVLGRELFVVTAMGPPSLLAVHTSDVENWFEGSAFVPLDETP